MAANPHDPNPPAMLAELDLHQGRKDLAQQVLEGARNNLKDNPAGYRMLGNFYLGQGEWDKAATEFASLHSEHPNDADVTKSYIEALIQLNRLNDAEKLNDTLLKNSPSDEGGLTFRGEILVRQGKPTDAITVLASVVKAAPQNALAHYHLGLAYAAASNFGQAQSQWQDAARLSPNAVEPERAIAALALRQRDFSLLTVTSQRLMQIEPRSSEGYLFHAQALLANGDNAGAKADLNKAAEIAPRDPAPLIQMGHLLMASKQFDEASKFYSQALVLNPSTSQALAGLVNIDLERKQPAQALRRVQEQLARVPANASLYTLLGQVEFHNQDTGKAEEAFEKAVDLDKHDIQALLLLGNAQVARGALDQAIASYQRGIQDNPREVTLYVSLGSLFERRGDWQHAQDLYQKALQVQPDYPLAANNLAYLMLEHGGNVNVALTLAQTGRRGLPNVPGSADTLGWAYYYQGAYTSAIDTLQQAVDEDPKNPNFHYHLGMAYEKANNYAMAKKQLEYTLQISPNYSHADEIRKVLSQSQ
jgi:tetratricopeptide (TPR) repeat protein